MPNVIKRHDNNVLFDTYYWHVFISKTSTNLLWSSTYFFSTHSYLTNVLRFFFVTKDVTFATNFITSNLLFSRRILSSFSSNSHQVFFSEKFCNTHSYFSNVLWFFCPYILEKSNYCLWNFLLNVKNVFIPELQLLQCTEVGFSCFLTTFLYKHI